MRRRTRHLRCAASSGSAADQTAPFLRTVQFFSIRIHHVQIQQPPQPVGLFQIYSHGLQLFCRSIYGEKSLTTGDFAGDFPVQDRIP